MGGRHRPREPADRRFVVVVRWEAAGIVLHTMNADRHRTGGIRGIHGDIRGDVLDDQLLTVTAILIPSGPSVPFRVRMREDLHAMVRNDSVAMIQNDGLVGNKFVQIGAGSEQAPRVAPEKPLERITKPPPERSP
jgi:hypothetical protein